jgi:EAL domain-containing protein (putative c-di-GMP-specific phosphodiesterase class I)
MKVSINLSGVTLNDETSLNFIRQTMTTSNLSPERISFEFTETAAIRDMARTEAFMGDLREWGCRFALDDFGSGLSSLKYLKRLPVDFLKIDGSFIRDLPNDAGSRAMVRAINQMARDLRIQTVAEVVENVETRDILQEVGIDFVQGYAIGIPRPL